MNASMKEHWDEIYEGLDVDELTWYEEIPEPSIRLLSKCHIKKDESILDVGAGASMCSKIRVMLLLLLFR